MGIIDYQEFTALYIAYGIFKMTGERVNSWSCGAVAAMRDSGDFSISVLASTPPPATTLW
jgi:hypothetical protein